MLRLHPRIAPYQVAVLPLSKKDTLLPLSQEVLQLLQPVAMCDYDVTAGHWPALPPPGRDRHPAVRDGRFRLPRGQGGHRARP